MVQLPKWFGIFSFLHAKDQINVDSYSFMHELFLALHLLSPVKLKPLTDALSHKVQINKVTPNGQRQKKDLAFFFLLAIVIFLFIHPSPSNWSSILNTLRCTI